MKKKHDPPPVHDRVPAMFVGDEPPPPQPVSAEALVAGAPAAAMLPDDLRVTTAGTSGGLGRLMIFSVMAVVYGVLAVMKALDPSVWSYILAGMYALVAMLGAWYTLGQLRRLVGRREEYRLDEDGIVMTVLEPKTRDWGEMRIRWTEIAEYRVSLDEGTLHLLVEKADGTTLSLKDSPPRLSTRELVRRFITEAERHPRATRHETSRLAMIAVFSFPVIMTLGAISEATLEFSERQESIVFNVILVIALGLYLWHTLDDDDVARSDATSDHLMARVRRWLRRVLGMRPI